MTIDSIYLQPMQRHMTNYRSHFNRRQTDDLVIRPNTHTHTQRVQPEPGYIELKARNANWHTDTLRVDGRKRFIVTRSSDQWLRRANSGCNETTAKANRPTNERTNTQTDRHRSRGSTEEAIDAPREQGPRWPPRLGANTTAHSVSSLWSQHWAPEVAQVNSSTGDSSQ